MTRFATDPQNTFSLEKDEETEGETDEVKEGERDEVKEGERDERGRESEN